MKNIFKILCCSLLVVSFSCKDSDNVIDDVLAYETGAILRTISVENAVLNASDPSSSFIVTVEEQDEEDGALLQEVRVYVQLRDLTTEYTTAATGDLLAKTIPASDFSTGPVGLPRTTVNLTFGEAAAALGLSLDEQNGYNPGDVFIVKLELLLTDGRVFGASSAAGIITGGYFSSPFQYNALLTCSPMPGTYVIDMYDNYGDGWQTGNYAHGVSIDIDGSVTEVAMCSQWGTYEFECFPTADGYYAQGTVEVPVGTGTANWSFEGDQYGEIAFVVTAPDGTIAFAGPSGQNPPTADDYGMTPAGLLPIAVCAQ
tara:strand:+ start:134 stop:1075 length:942 start_codon:yes stop_codon:yes gene_type:complete